MYLIRTYADLTIVFFLGYTFCFVLFFLCPTFTFQLLDKLWSQVSPLLPPSTCLQFLSRIGFSIPTAHHFSSNAANLRSRAFRESICAQENGPTNLYECMHSGGLELVQLTYSRHEDNLLHHRGVFILSLCSTGYLSLFYSLIAHSITLAHPG